MLLLAAAVVVLRFGAVWDGAGPGKRNAVVIVQGNRIAAVRKDDGKYPPSSKVIDLRRYSAIPGMIDVHTHITYYWDRAPGTRPRDRRNVDRETALRDAAANGRLTLQTGVTTVRDMSARTGLDYALRDAIHDGKTIGPRIVAAGLGIGAFPDPPGVEGIRKQVAQRIAAGSDVIKLFGSEGSYEVVRGGQKLSAEEMKAAVETAHAAGKRIAIHAYGPEAFRAAVQAGPDSIEHGADVDDATLREMARKKIWFVPTIDHNRYYIDAQQEFGFSPGSDGPLRDYIQRNLDTARRAHKAGVKFAMGSDAVFTMFGQNTRELEWLRKAGLSDEEALRAATTNGAELLGSKGQIGVLAPGALADIVAVEGEPWKDVTTVIRGVRWVMKDGQEIPLP